MSKLGGMNAILQQMMGTAGASLEQLRADINDVRWSDTLDGSDFTFTFRGAAYGGVLRGRNADYVLSEHPAANAKLALRVLLDGDALPL